MFQKNTLNTIADDTNSAGDKIHPIAQPLSSCKILVQLKKIECGQIRARFQSLTYDWLVSISVVS